MNTLAAPEDASPISERYDSDTTNSSSVGLGTVFGAANFTQRELELINQALGYFGREDHFKRPKGRALRVRKFPKPA